MTLSRRRFRCARPDPLRAAAPASRLPRSLSRCAAPAAAQLSTATSPGKRVRRDRRPAGRDGDGPRNRLRAFRATPPPTPRDATRWPACARASTRSASRWISTSPRRARCTALVGQTLDVNFSVRPDLAYTETVQVVSERLSRHPHQRDRDQRHAGTVAVPAAEQPQLPQLRGARAGPARGRQRVPQGSDVGRAAVAAHQRLHRRRQLQERPDPRRRGRTGLQPRQSVPAERGPGVPGPDPELQGGVREGVERGHHRDHPQRRQRLPRRAVQLLPGQGAGPERGRPPGQRHLHEDRRPRNGRGAEADLRALAVGRLARRPDRARPPAVLRIVRREPPGSRRHRDRRAP